MKKCIAKKLLPLVLLVVFFTPSASHAYVAMPKDSEANKAALEKQKLEDEKAAKGENCFESPFASHLSDLFLQAEKNSSKAQYTLGIKAFQRSRYVGFHDKNDARIKEAKEQSFYWFKLAAERGHMKSMARLAQQYYWGEGVEKNDEESYFWMELFIHAALSETPAVKERSREGLIRGYLPEHGKGLTEEQKKRLDTRAQTWKPLPDNSLNVQITPFFKRLHGMELKASGGHLESMLELGNRYKQGCGVPRDYAVAFKWYRQAAGYGDLTAYSNLSWMYRIGYGVQQDWNEAYFWHLAEVVISRRTMSHQPNWKQYLSPEQLRDTRDRAKEWLQKHNNFESKARASKGAE